MFAGHVGVGLALGSAAPRANVALFVTAALWLDLVLWVLILLGWESARVGAEFHTIHQPVFEFPFSHGLLAALAWSALLAGAAALGAPAARARIALLMFAAALSHWGLDALVHTPGLPVAGAASRAVGLGLWRQLPLALALECALAVAGAVLFVRRAALPRARRLALLGLTGALCAFTVAGMTLAPPPPSATAMAAASLATLLVVCGLFAWLGRGAP
ncbi:MAG TPA: hypothetical protein VFQ16_15370 [Burkholderiaceae bacterium]|nr:hypothetical protein [Burkholderiaceae bacterium]